MSLKPDNTIQKILISTTSRLLGEYESDDLLITHAWPSEEICLGHRLEENPVSRSSYIVAFRTVKTKKKDKFIPDYSYVGGLICSFLAVLYGKRFDCHGLTEGSGFYNTPNLNAYSTICNHHLTINSHQPRKCFFIPLNLVYVSILEKLLTDPSIDKAFLSKFEAGCKFYLQALQNAEFEPEIAYLHLITSWEIISSFFSYKKEDLINENMLKNLDEIRQELKNGQKVANCVSSNLFSIKRRFVKSLLSSVDNDFFKNHETSGEYGFFQPNDFEKRIGAAYDLRSKYVHTGVSFGRWIKPKTRNEDIQFGKPIVDDKEYAKILAKAPTFSGLERVVRYCLLKFLNTNGFEIPNIA